ncbi:hypothetical protein D3C76_567990 [compost metagenome]
MGADQVPAARELLPFQAKLQMPAGHSLVRIADGYPVPLVPDDDIAGAVVTRRYIALEFRVVQRVILHLDGKTFHRRIEAGSLGHGPALEHAVQLQAEVIVQVAGVMLLDDERQAAALPSRRLAARLRSAAEVALAGIFLQHRPALPFSLVPIRQGDIGSLAGKVSSRE